MSWVAVAIGSTALGAGTKYFEAQQQQKQQQAAMNANATAIAMSPWTHANVGIMQGTAGSPTAAAVGGALQGGLSGVMMGSANGAFKNAPAAATGASMNNMNLSQGLQQPQLGSQFQNPYQTLYGK